MGGRAGRKDMDSIVGGRCRKHKFHEGEGSFFTYRLVVWHWNVLQGHRGWHVGQNTYDFLLLFYSNAGRISYCFCVTLDFMRKWPFWATVTSKWQWRSTRSPPRWNHLETGPRPSFGKISYKLKSTHNLLREDAHRQTDRQTEMTA